MKFKNRRDQLPYFVFLIILFFGKSYAIQNQDSISTELINNLLPTPRVIEQMPGKMVLSSESVIYFNEDNIEIKSALSRFLDLLEERFRLRLAFRPKKGLRNYQIIIKNNNSIKSEDVTPDPKLKSKGDEAYELLVHTDGINIEANASKGARWALMTLLQLGSLEEQVKIMMPSVKILDWPHYPWRGYMLDTGRAPYSIAQIKRTIRICSTFKLNFLMIREGDDELNAIKYDKLKLGHENPFALTIKELTDIIDYGEEFGIMVFPEIESLGHAGAKRYHYPDLVEGDMYSDFWPGFSHLKKANLKVGNPGTYQLLQSIYEELFPLLRVPIIHLGLDEVRLSKKDQADHLHTLLPLVQKTGEKYNMDLDMIVWSDAPPTPPEFQDRVIRCLWVYDESISLDDQFANEQGLATFIKPGCKQKVFMSAGSGTKHPPYSKGSYKGALENLSSWAMLGKDYPNFIGVLAVQWGTNIIDEWFPNFLMTAEFAWNVPDQEPDYNSTMDGIMLNLQKIKDFTQPDPESVDRPVWLGIWLKGRYFDEDIMTGKKAAPEVEIFPKGESFHQVSTPVVIKSNFPQTKIYYTLDGSEPNRNSNYYYSPFQVTETKTVRAKGFLAGRPESYTKTQVFASLDFQDPEISDILSQGIRYHYYLTDVYSVLDIPEKDKKGEGITDRITIIDRAEGVEKFALVFSGYIKVKKEGLYTFYLSSNDGSKLYINKKELIDNNGRHPSLEKQGKIALRKGDYPIKVTYFQNGGGKELKLSWSSAWLDKQEIPSHVLYHAK